MTISLSPTSLELIAKLDKSNPDLVTLLQNNATTIARKDLLAWLAQTSKTKTNHEAFFLISALQSSLLKDFKNSLNPGVKEEEDKRPSKAAVAKYGLLALAGSVYFFCEGFDSITAFMEIFSSIPTFVFFITGTVFSVLSMILFYGFDLAQISKNLGIKSSETPQLVDVLLEQFKEIKAIRARINQVAGKTREQLAADLELAVLLYQRHLDLKEARDKLNLALNNPYLKAGKYITAGVVGLIFFSGGFFAGQTMALAIAGLFVSSIAVTAWPVVVASIAVGIAALSVYWFVERPGIENLVSRWRGLDKKKIEQLSKSDIVEKESDKLFKLQKELENGISHLDNEEADKRKIKELEEKAAQVDTLQKEVSRLNLLTDSLQKKTSHVDELETEVTRLQKEVSQLKGELEQSADPIEVHSPKEEEASPLLTFSHFRRVKSESNLYALQQKDMASSLPLSQ